MFCNASSVFAWLRRVVSWILIFQCDRGLDIWMITFMVFNVIIYKLWWVSCVNKLLRIVFTMDTDIIRLWTCKISYCCHINWVMSSLTHRWWKLRIWDSTSFLKGRGLGFNIWEIIVKWVLLLAYLWKKWIFVLQKQTSIVLHEWWDILFEFFFLLIEVTSHFLL